MNNQAHQDAWESKPLIAGGAKKLMGTIGAKSRDLWQVPVGQIKVLKGFNVREKDDAYHAHIKALAKSIEMEGFFQDKPLAGYVAKEADGDVIYLTDGHCRYEAVQQAITDGATIESLPVVVKPNSCSLEDLTVALVVSNTGKPLTPYETGVVVKRLQGFGWDSEKVAERLQLSVQYVDQLLTLMGAPLEIRRMVQAGQVSAAIAVEMLRKHAADAVGLLLQAHDKASKSGSKKVTAKHLPGAKLKKELTKQAPVMRETLSAIQADPGFEGLKESIRQKLHQLLKSLEEAAVEQDASKDDSAQDSLLTS